MNTQQKEILRTVESINSIYPDIEWNIPREKKKSIEYHVRVAEKLAKGNGGLLPKVYWLQQNGYKDLDNCMRKYPEKFSHIPQDRKWKTEKQHVADAKRLAKENGGILPNPKWLIDNGYSNLYAYMSRYSELFKHIPQDSKKGKSLEEWFIIAEVLMKKHNGVLPNSSWLKKNGYGGLDRMIRKYPGRFKHIPQNNKSKTKEEHVADAKRLAKENGGILPSPIWLSKNEYHGLISCMRKYPELFQNIRQDSKRGKTKEEWVIVAGELTKKHGGTLPNPKWLRENGYNALCDCMMNNPKLFKHIPQDRKKTKEEHIEDAKRLAKEHGGILPGCKWLRDNGYGTLYAYIRTYPELFKRIPQRSRS